MRPSLTVLLTVFALAATPAGAAVALAPLLAAGAVDSAGAARQEGWLVRRAAILEEAGRPAEAAASLRGALLEIERLPHHRRSAPAIVRLEEGARLSLARLEAAR